MVEKKRKRKLVSTKKNTKKRRVLKMDGKQRYSEILKEEERNGWDTMRPKLKLMMVLAMDMAASSRFAEVADKGLGDDVHAKNA